MRRAALLAAALALAAPVAMAQDAPRETVLKLAESAERRVRADELHASLRAEAQGSSVAAVQQAVNRAAQAALERARAVPGVTVATGGYHTWREGERLQTWRAMQEIRLSATEAAPALLDLVGELQAQGLALGGLTYRVSRPLERRTREELAAEALVALKTRAERLAGVLGLGFAGFREVRVDLPTREGGPLPRPMAAARADSAQPPAAEPEEVLLTATVEGEAILIRR
ncbi:SIMPL domain-containing protein [Elioraea thermophila]|uniref:SIMPL domain-containing protein n=1 Tax=Elioraea thermophila TaxID=2185104 RepID=UPI000DF2A2A8|nr:SIMPL domain-containing protein [Elioraea thermophila]